MGGMSRTGQVLQFRHSSALTVAAFVTAITGLSLGAWAVPWLPLLVLPVAVAVWSWRAGTDVAPAGVTVRAALGSRRIAWSEIDRIATNPDGRVVAYLTTGTAMVLPAVSRADLPAVVAVAGTR
jgi:hypothetical protein